MQTALDVVDGMRIDSSWGSVHRIVFRHPMAEIPVAGRLLAGSWNRGPFPAGGDDATVDANYWDRLRPFDVTATPALRMVTDVGNWDASVVAMPLGQSGRPWSSHYADQVQLWRGGGAFRLAFGEAAVEAETEARLILRPESE
jgi:penicillin amidase